jgi:hypothetical protein
MGDARRTIDQRTQIALRPANRKVFEHVAARVHKRDDRAGEWLSERQRSNHRYQRDGIYTNAAVSQVLHDRITKTRDHWNRGGKPALIGKGTVTGNARGRADRQSRSGDGDERSPQQPIDVDRLLHSKKSRKRWPAPSCAKSNEKRRTFASGPSRDFRTA